MYHETTPFIVFICNKKRVHEIFLKSNLQIMQLKISTSILGFKNCFLTYSALQTLVPPNLCLLLRLSHIFNIFNDSFSSSLNRLNTLSLIKNLHKSVMHRTWVHNTLITILLKQQRNGTFNVKTIINFDYTLFLSSVELFQGDFLNKMYI